MGFFDLICPPRVPPGPPPEETTLFPQEGSCQNCHQERPAQSDCPALEDWPRELYRPTPSIARNPDAFRWWIDENHLRTELRRRSREDVFPFEVGEHSLQIEVDPNERRLDNWFVTGQSRFTVNLQGEGMQIFLNRGPLVAGRNIRLIDSFRIFTQEHYYHYPRWDFSLTSDSTLINFFVQPHTAILEALPVAYDPESGQTYNYTEYTRQVLIQSQCGAPTVIPEGLTPMDGGIPLPSDSGVTDIDARPALDLPPEILEEMRQSAPDLGTGYADAGCSYGPALPIRLPYLFELAFNWARHREEATQIDLLRLYRDLLALQRISSRFPSNNPQVISPLSNLDRAHIVWNLRPQRLAFENFLMEFDAPTQRHPISMTMDVRTSGLYSLQMDNRIYLSRLYVPGWIHLGETSFHLRGTGPQLDVRLSEIDSEILPFDVGQTNPSERGFFHVVRGRVRDGEEINEENLHLLPGIRVEGDPEHSLNYSANLHVDLTMEIPEPIRVMGLTILEAGSYDVSGNLVASGRLLRTPNGFEPEVGSTAISLRHFSMTPHPEAGHPGSPRPLIREATLTLNDVPDAQNRRTGIRVHLNIPEENFPFFQGVNLEGFVPLRAFDPATHRYFHDFPPLLYSSQALYRPDLSFEDFQTELNFQLLGRRGSPNLDGRFHFTTQRADGNIRTFEALFHTGPVGLPLDGGIYLYLNPIHAHFQAVQETAEDGTCHFEIPILELLANYGGGRRPGILQGRVEIAQRPRGRHSLEMHYDPSSRNLEIENLDLRLLAQRISIPALRSASREEPGSAPQVTSLDVDGRLRGHWTADTETGRGHGRVCLVGDSADVSLRGRDGRILSDPLISDTQWCASSITRTDPRHEIMWGNFFLDTTVDWGLLRYFGIHLNMRVRGRMTHDNLPYSPRGYRTIERLFFRRVLEEHRRFRTLQGGDR